MCEWPDERQGFGRPSFNVQPVSGNAPTPQNSQGLSLFDYFLLLFFFFFCMRYIKCALCFIAKKESQETETDNDRSIWRLCGRVNWSKESLEAEATLEVKEDVV